MCSSVHVPSIATVYICSCNFHASDTQNVESSYEGLVYLSHPIIRSPRPKQFFFWHGEVDQCCELSCLSVGNNSQLRAGYHCIGLHASIESSHGMERIMLSSLHEAILKMAINKVLPECITSPRNDLLSLAGGTVHSDAIIILRKSDGMIMFLRAYI